MLSGDSRRIGFVQLVIGFGQCQAFGFHSDNDVVVLKDGGRHGRRNEKVRHLCIAYFAQQG